MRLSHLGLFCLLLLGSSRFFLFVFTLSLFLSLFCLLLLSLSLFVIDSNWELFFLGFFLLIRRHLAYFLLLYIKIHLTL